MSAAEAVRWFLMLVACAIVGLNLALAAHASKVLNAARAWRVFVLGKCLLTGYVIVVLWAHRQYGWRWQMAPLAVALLTIVVGLFLLDREYRRRNP